MRMLYVLLGERMCGGQGKRGNDVIVVIDAKVI